MLPSPPPYLFFFSSSIKEDLESAEHATLQSGIFEMRLKPALIQLMKVTGVTLAKSKAEKAWSRKTMEMVDKIMIEQKKTQTSLRLFFFARSRHYLCAADGDFDKSCQYPRHELSSSSSWIRPKIKLSKKLADVSVVSRMHHVEKIVLTTRSFTGKKVIEAKPTAIRATSFRSTWIRRLTRKV
ncbi:hypothetical protein PIB30_016188 [Stylosanthes scabra]|uniref:Uncharacterized protein n=1 Tax=Stylosanthes scabra TaxID=79078 RepID=A0ABU6U7J3_9FABA|nr:hypothetical protein [Stylosanthes scabra]